MVPLVPLPSMAAGRGSAGEPATAARRLACLSLDAAWPRRGGGGWQVSLLSRLAVADGQTGVSRPCCSRRCSCSSRWRRCTQSWRQSACTTGRQVPPDRRAGGQAGGRAGGRPRSCRQRPNQHTDGRGRVWDREEKKRVWGRKKILGFGLGKQATRVWGRKIRLGSGLGRIRARAWARKEKVGSRP